MEISKIRETDLRKIGGIDMGFYEDYSTPLEVLVNWQNVFPDGFFVAEENGNIAGYVFVEMFEEIKTVPFIHDAKTTHTKNGKYIYVSGFGVGVDFEKAGEILTEHIIEFAKSKKCKAIIWVTGEKMKHDIYERQLIEKFGFERKERIEKWESHPSHFVSDHFIWIKELQSNSIPHNPDELVAIVDENDKVVGADTRDNVHKKGLLHREIAVMVFNSKGEMLLQKRKDNGRYSFSAGGHFSASENCLQAAMRETKEEIGIELKESKLKEIAKLRRDVSRDGLRNNVFLRIFEARKDFRIRDFKIDKSEVESIKFFSIEQIEKMISYNPESFGRGFRKMFEMFYKNRG